MPFGLPESVIFDIVRGNLRKQGDKKAIGDLRKFALGNIVLRGNPFSFAGHEYLRGIYAEKSPRTVFMKAAQVGISTYHLVKALQLAQVGCKTVYFLPTSGMATAFGKERFRPLLDQSFPDGYSGPADAVRVSDGTVLFRGLLSEEGVRSIDADFVVLDEFDVASPQRAELAADRLLHSELGWLSYLSTPTLPGVGVDKLYAESDRKRWHVNCGKCRWEGDLLYHFPDCLLEKDGVAVRVCPHCYNPVDVFDGRWVVAYPSRDEISGYLISHLDTSLPAETILKDYREAAKSYQVRRFYNSILGLPYAEKTAGLAPDEVGRAFAPMPERYSGVYLGVDVGDVIYSALVVRTDDYLFATSLDKHTSFDGLDRLMERYRVSSCVIDAMPYKASAAAFARRWSGRVHLAYLGSGKYAPGAEYHPEGEVPKLGLDRTVALDELIEDIRAGALKLQRGEAGEKAGEHLLNLYRIITENSVGKSKTVWRSRGEDHFAFALLFAREAARLSASTDIPKIGEGRFF
ncbi:MAG: hypothetical protein GY771_04975 [bacterium]|nr:hypothetical protein [bacterium]